MSPAAASHALADHAGSLASIALVNVQREFPNAPAHTVLRSEDRQLPRQLHPTFYGAFDWHSAVHMHWLLVRLLRTHPHRIDAVQVRQVLNDHLTAPALQIEADYLRTNPGWGAALRVGMAAHPRRRVHHLGHRPRRPLMGVRTAGPG